MIVSYKTRVMLLAAIALALVIPSLQAQPPRPPRESHPAPRNADGRIILGSVPGEIVGMWSGFGTRPMLTVFDVIPEGSIIAYTPYEDVLKVADRYPKIKLSEVPYQPWAKALFQARSRTRFEPYTRCKPSGGPREM